jgi:hypothetical protein
MCTRGETLQENRGSPLQETLKETLRKGLGEDITKKNLEENYENKKRGEQKPIFFLQCRYPPA